MFSTGCLIQFSQKQNMNLKQNTQFFDISFQHCTSHHFSKVSFYITHVNNLNWKEVRQIYTKVLVHIN